MPEPTWYHYAGLTEGDYLLAHAWLGDNGERGAWACALGRSHTARITRSRNYTPSSPDWERCPWCLQYLRTQEPVTWTWAVADGDGEAHAYRAGADPGYVAFACVLRRFHGAPPATEDELRNRGLQFDRPRWRADCVSRRCDGCVEYVLQDRGLA